LSARKQVFQKPGFSARQNWQGYTQKIDVEVAEEKKYLTPFSTFIRHDTNENIALKGGVAMGKVIDAQEKERFGTVTYGKYRLRKKKVHEQEQQPQQEQQEQQEQPEQPEQPEQQELQE
jgi:hypothetical protein